VVALSEVIPKAEYGVSVPLGDQVRVPVLRMNNVVDGEIDVSGLTYSRRAETSNILLKPLDVLFYRTNSMEHVGRASAWRGQIETSSISSYLVRLVPDRAMLNSEYLNLFLNLPTTYSSMRRLATPGVHQVKINSTNLRMPSIAIPLSVDEQEEIVQIADDLRTLIRAEQDNHHKLRLIRKGLMHNLLTGWVRINYHEEAVV
jgi:type I restriction enzyme S subunit